jgi:hypothetical protein
MPPIFVLLVVVAVLVALHIASAQHVQMDIHSLQPLVYVLVFVVLINIIMLQSPNVLPAHLNVPHVQIQQVA